MKIRRICVLGGTGFVGHHLLYQLSSEGRSLRVLTRHRERHRDLLLLPGMELVQADVHDPLTLQEQLQGCDAAINLVGILNDRSADGAHFRRAHVELPRKLVEACLATGVRRLLHMSAINADATQAPSQYLRSKGEGEDLVHAAAGQGLQVTSFRPSTIFGPGDGFLNRFAALLRVSPFFFPLACPESRFAPVFVGDVVQAYAQALENPATYGRRYELCGPKIYTLRELVRYVAELLVLRRAVVGLGDRVSRLQARIFQHVPGQPFTMDNYLSLQVDSVCGSNGLAELGITPVSLEAIAPTYIGRRPHRPRYHTDRVASTGTRIA
jgi:uncharacterized protein YbjT (DUF2867 family)